MIRESSYNALVVSANEKFNQVLASIMPPDEFVSEVVGNVGEARRVLLERDFDIVIVNTPLPDEFGVNFAIDTGDRTGSGVLLCVNAEFFDEVTDKCEDYGIFRGKACRDQERKSCEVAPDRRAQHDREGCAQVYREARDGHAKEQGAGRR